MAPPLRGIIITIMSTLVPRGGWKSEFPAIGPIVSGVKKRRPTNKVLWELKIINDCDDHQQQQQTNKQASKNKKMKWLSDYRSRRCDSESPLNVPQLANYASFRPLQSSGKSHLFNVYVKLNFLLIQNQSKNKNCKIRCSIIVKIL